MVAKTKHTTSYILYEVQGVVNKQHPGIYYNCIHCFNIYVCWLHAEI